jgi:hypothetical protein
MATITMKKSLQVKKKCKHQNKQLPHLVPSQKPYKPFYGVGQLYPEKGS